MTTNGIDQKSGTSCHPLETMEFVTGITWSRSPIFWIRDESLTDLDNLPDPNVLANEIVENIEAGLENFREVVNGLEK